MDARAARCRLAQKRGLYRPKPPVTNMMKLLNRRQTRRAAPRHRNLLRRAVRPVSHRWPAEARRIARDPESIDARLDLHGMRQREAYPALKGFVRASQGRGHRLLLVITGKGTARETGREDYDAWADTPFYEAPRGVLRRLVPEWLSKPEFRDVVAGVSPAHPRHGGEGALYVRLRSAGPRPTTPRSPSKGD
jgi:DNA-nicking Smr family endonuclease